MVLDDVKTLLGIESTDTSKDGKLNIQIRKAVITIKNYLKCNQNTNVEDIYPDALMELATYYYRNAGKESVKQEQQGSRNTVYMDSKLDIPSTVKALLPMPSIRMMG